MAVVFISPKQRQKMFFLGITAVFALFLAFVALGVFLSEPEESQSPLVFNKPKVNINFKILDSEEFKKLEPFSKIELQFVYTATDDDGVETQGFISAASLNDAIEDLEAMNLTIINLQEVKSGRENPFEPYYQATITPPAAEE